MPLNFSQLLGGAAFSSLNAILGHNASRDGYSRPNRFEVIITLPAGVSGASSQGAGDSALASNIAALRSGETARRISFRCNTISMPDRSLRTVVNSNIYGPTHDIVQGQTYATVSATFYLSSDMAERYFFEEWQKATFNTDTYDINYYKEYIGSVDIFALNDKDESQYGIRLEECFPDTIGGVAFSHEKATSVNTFTVSFKFRYFRNLGTEPSSDKEPLESTLSDILKNSVVRQVQSRIPRVLRRLF